ncbi:MAG: DNA translocase FtsK 4TM domain-containing protein [Candidatus Paceibacterota bacterium]
MSSKKNKKPALIAKNRWYHNLKDETKHSILAITSLALALLFTLAPFGKAGFLGDYIYKFFDLLFGSGFFLVPTAFFLASFSLLTSVRPHFLITTVMGMILFLFSSLGATDVIFGEKTGGYIGYVISLPLLKLFDFWLSLILLAAIFVISLLIMLNTSISLKRKDKEVPTPGVGEKQSIIASAIESVKEKIEEMKPAKSKKEEEQEEIKLETRRIKSVGGFVPPPLELLEEDKGKPSSGDIKANSNIIKRTLQNFGIEVEMGEINIGPSVTQYTLKPAEGIKLSRIIALQNDLSLALAAHPIRIEAPIPGKSLVGIEIPNSAKTIVGLATLLADEGYQKSSKPLLVSLGKDVSGKIIFSNLSKMPHLLIAGATGAGKSICIHSIITNLLYRNSPESLRFIMIDPKRVELTVYNKIPHLLTPVITEAKKAIMTLKWAAKEMDRRYDILLKAGVRDIGSYHEKNNEYNSPPATPERSDGGQGMPYLVIIIDELADLMSTYPREMEAAVVRLAQMSRAVGIHLVISTQRPSVEVITGLIKANIPSRIALQVTSQIDSRTILDMSGAEKLLGNGDMLYLANDTAKPRRIQGPFISEKEIKKVVKYLAEQYKDVDLEEIDDIEAALPIGSSASKSEGQGSFSLDFDDNSPMDDELYEEAREMVIKTGKASSSYLQRRFKIGYARAARLLDILEERGVVSAGEGAKPREVLIKENGGNDNNAADYKENTVDF